MSDNDRHVTGTTESPEVNCRKGESSDDFRKLMWFY